MYADVVVWDIILRIIYRSEYAINVKLAVLHAIQPILVKVAFKIIR